LETGMLDNYDEPNQTTSTNGKPMDSKESEKKPQRIAELFFESSEVLLTVRSYFDQFQTLPYNSLIFGTRVQPDGNSTAHRWVHGAEQAKSPQTINFQKLCDFKPLPNVEKRRKNERTVSTMRRDLDKARYICQKYEILWKRLAHRRTHFRHRYAECLEERLTAVFH
jgi:hypothetical protein